MCQHVFVDVENVEKVEKLNKNGMCKNCQIPLRVYNIDAFGYNFGDIIGPKREFKRRLIPPLRSVLNPSIHTSWQELLDFLQECQTNQIEKIEKIEKINKKRKIIIIDDEDE